VKSYHFEIAGPPVVQERARKSKQGHFYDPSKEAKDELAWQLLKQKAGQGMPLLLNDVVIEVVFYGVKRGDADNCLKALFDAGNGILWRDDRQIIGREFNVVRRSDEPRTVFVVKDIGKD